MLEELPILAATVLLLQFPSNSNNPYTLFCPFLFFIFLEQGRIEMKGVD